MSKNQRIGMTTLQRTPFSRSRASIHCASSALKAGGGGSRQGRALAVRVPQRSRREPLHGAIDSSGLQVYGAGEWKLRQYGASRRRTWRTVHWAVICASSLGAAVAVTDARIHDSTGVEPWS